MTEVPSMSARDYYDIRLTILSAICGALSVAGVLAMIILGSVYKTTTVLYILIPLAMVVTAWIIFGNMLYTLSYSSGQWIPDRMHMNTKEEYTFKISDYPNYNYIKYDVLVKMTIFLNFYTYLDTNFKIELPVRQDDPPTDYEIQQAWVDKKIKWQAENSKTTVIV